MSIKYAVLGLLRERSMHGYAVRAAFEERLGDLWDLNYGQVYQVLTALEQEGFIGGTEERVGRRPTRRVFTISAKGRDALRNWLVHPFVLRPFRDEFYVRLLFTDDIDRDLVRDLINRQIRDSREYLASLMDRRGSFDKRPMGNRDTKARRLFADAAILHAKADVEALELCQARLLPDATEEAEPKMPSISRRRRTAS
jgi:DNA-binding PadR family transcriptional regulator